MQELAIILGGILLGGAGLVIWLNMTSEWAERDQLRRFQKAMRDADSPTLPPRED